MKENPLDSIIREKLKPGKISAEGFLGNDKRQLDEIIEQDKFVIEEAGFTTEVLGKFLLDIHDKADLGQEGNVSLFNGKMEARALEVMGRIPCPFGCGSRTHKANVILTLNTKTEFIFTPLQAHLIATHGFFGGIGSKYRIEPDVLIGIYKQSLS